MAQTDVVSLAALKKLAVSHLKDGVLKNLILQEPDYLPRSEALAKIDIFSRLLEEELKA